MFHALKRNWHPDGMWIIIAANLADIERTIYQREPDPFTIFTSLRADRVHLTRFISSRAGFVIDRLEKWEELLMNFQ